MLKWRATGKKKIKIVCPLLCFHMSHTFDPINDKRQQRECLHLQILLWETSLPSFGSESPITLALYSANLKIK